jgi:hypothetical protein
MILHKLMFKLMGNGCFKCSTRVNLCGLGGVVISAQDLNIFCTVRNLHVCHCINENHADYRIM